MPRTPRILAPWTGEPGAESALYHCLSRVVNREFVLQRPEKEEFVRLMRLYASFCGVRILTFCVMSNHFHLLVEVPPRPEGGLSDGELYQRLRLLYSEAKVAQFCELLEHFRRVGDAAGAEEFKERFLYRMWDLSEFMKTLKQCFTRWFNKKHNRHGTLWEERFKNVLVEDGYAARVMAAYIDLNPVRARMVRKPEDYRWCGYAAGLAGRCEARLGIERLMETYERLAGGTRSKRNWRSDIRRYRLLLFSDGQERTREDPVTGKIEVAWRGLSGKEVEKVLKRGGKLSPAEMLACRVRALTDGAVIGTEKFVNAFFEAKRDLFGASREDGARTIYGCETKLRTLRGLRKNALG
jgi:REP element-mobilizing transposase RayT